MLLLNQKGNEDMNNNINTSVNINKQPEELLRLAEQLFQSTSEEDKIRAVEYCTIAANQGDRDAQFRLAVAYENGEGVPWPDDGQAFLWYKKAAQNRHFRAKYKYACALHWGIGVPAEDHEYLIDGLLYEAACYAKDPDAAFMMAYFNYSYWWNGETEVDWYRIAAEHGNGKAQYQLAHALICDDHYTRNRCFDDVKAEALEWLHRSSHNGITAASYTLWKIYSLGLWGEQIDREKAEYWYSEKERNQFEHQDNLSFKAECCRKYGPRNPHGQYLRGVNALGTYGKNLPRYTPAALGWFRAAADQGHVGAQNYLNGHTHEPAIPIEDLLSWNDPFTGYMRHYDLEREFYADMIILASEDDLNKWRNAAFE